MTLCVHNLAVCSSSNDDSFRTSSNTAACIGLLLCSWQDNGGAISNRGGSAVITGSEFEGNTATNYGNNIYNFEDMGGGYVACNDMNTFVSSGGGGNDDSDGNYPTGLCE